MDANPQNRDDQEIDLTMISKNVNNFFGGVGNFFFRMIRYVVRNMVVLLILLLAGAGLGIYLDTVNKIYYNAIIVRPNFGSTDNIYSKVALLNSRVAERDTVFLKAIGIQDPLKLSKIEMKPIVDVYQFISNRNDKSFELLKLMAEDGDINKIVEEKITSKNYTYHVISFQTKKRTTEKKTIQPILKYLNNSEFFKKVQREYVRNIHLKMQANESTIQEIDSFLASLSRPETAQGNKLVSFNENTQLNDVLQTKERLLNEQGYQRIELLSFDKILKESTIMTNIEDKKAVNGKLKLILPILFVLLYVCLYSFRNFYKKHAFAEQSKTL